MRRTTEKTTAWEAFDGSRALFESCWREMSFLRRQGNAIDDVDDFLETLASEKVNDPDSSYYIYG